MVKAKEESKAMKEDIGKFLESHSPQELAEGVRTNWGSSGLAELLIDNMPVLELATFVKALQEKYGVTASVPIATSVSAGGVAGAPVQQAEEQTSFDVILAGVAADKKIQIIKTVGNSPTWD